MSDKVKAAGRDIRPGKVLSLDGFIKAERDEDGIMIWVDDAVGKTAKIHLSWHCLGGLQEVTRSAARSRRTGLPGDA